MCLLELARADVRWKFSTRPDDLPASARAAGATSYRRLVVDGEEIEFSDGIADLHTKAYEGILAGRGFGLADARPSIELVHHLRHAPVNRSQHV